MPMSSVKIKENDHGSVEPATVAGISAFLGKLWKMVEDPKTDHLIAWGKSGNSFVIKNQIDFAKTILPNYYKHNNIASFIRQLNMYGFHKIISTTSGALDSVDNDEIEFTHPNFVRGRPYLLEQIKRKMNNPKENIVKNENNVHFNDSVKKILVDIKHLKGKQDNLNSQLCSVKQENEILWRELSLLRQKHAAQQNILNKLIRFLVSLATPSNHNLVKRRLIPLMLKDSTSSTKVRHDGPIIQESDHMYTMKKRDARSPGPTIHEIHSSDIMDDDDSTDEPMLIRNEIVNSPTSSISPSETSIASPEPVPAALLRSDRRGKKRIQTVYLTPEQRVSPHFLISQSDVGELDPTEYLVPDQTDNPLLELVHETEGDDDNEYITVLADDSSEILQDSIPTTLITESLSDAELRGRSGSGRKQVTPRKKSATRKSNIVGQTVVDRVPVPRIKQNAKKKATLAAARTGNKNKNATNTLKSDDFLFDINLQTEPLIEIHTPKTTVSGNDGEQSPKYASVHSMSPNSQLKVEIPISMEDAILNMSPNVDSTNSSNVPINANLLLSPHNQINPVSPINPISPMSPVTPNVNLLSPSSGMNQNSRSDVTSSPGSHVVEQVEQAASPQKNSENTFMEQMNECIGNAQNMKIACTTDNLGQSKTYVDDISSQLDSMQADINSLKELMHNEGLTLDVNTLLGLFSEDPMNYNMPSESYKPNEEKIMGNELISASPVFDFNDIFSNDWNQPSTPISSYDSDYYNLNTPQIERNTDDTQLFFTPPNKKIKI